MRRLLRLRNARLLLIGEALSLLGDRALFLALAIWVKSLTGSNTKAGLVFFAVIAPSLLAPLLGHIVDRVHRRSLMITTDLVTALVVLALLLVRSEQQVWLIYSVAVVYGLSSVLLNSARPALMTVALPTEMLSDANGLFQSLAEGLRLVAPLAGAGLFAAFGGGSVAVMDAATFVVSAFCLTALRVDEPEPVPSELSFTRTVMAGLVFIRRDDALRPLMLWFGGALLVIGFTETTAFAVVAEGLHRPPSFLGVLLSLQGVGAIVGGVSAARMIKAIGDIRTVGCGLLLVAVAVAALVTHSTALALAAMALAGVGVSFAIVGHITALQTRTPQNLLGRVFAAGETLLSVPQAVSIATGAILLGFIDYKVLLAAVALTSAAAGLVLATREHGRERSDALTLTRR
jgi:predicted MFS family arabinose efflux permease